MEGEDGVKGLQRKNVSRGRNVEEGLLDTSKGTYEVDREGEENIKI